MTLSYLQSGRFFVAPKEGVTKMLGAPLRKLREIGKSSEFSVPKELDDPGVETPGTGPPRHSAL
jgi:hypothetical protein